MGAGDGFDFGLEFAGVFLAEVAFAGEGAEDDGVDAFVEVGTGGGCAEAAEGEFAGEHFVEDNAEGIDVGAVIDLRWILELLRRHVVGCAKGCAGAGEGDGTFFFADDFGDSEVGDLHAAAGVEEDVFGFDIAVEDAFFVGVLECVADFGDDGEGFGGRKFTHTHGLAEVESVNEFHDEVIEAAGVAEVVDHDDVWMVEAGEDAGFAHETLGEVRIGAELPGEKLEGDFAAEMKLAGFIDIAHAAAADEFEDLELREDGPELVDGGDVTQTGAGQVGGGCSAGRGVGQDAFRAEAAWGIGRDGGLAFRTNFLCIGSHTQRS